MSDFEAWKRALLTLPGDRFLVLVRNYLGEIRTPYDKQDLIRRLAAFLSDRAVRERIVALVSEREGLLITALLMLGRATLDGLAALFDGRIGLLALGEMAASLEERLLVYRERAEAPFLAVNPVLEPVLRSEVFDSGALLPWRVASAPAGGLLWVSDGTLLALLSHLCGQAMPQKKGGGLRKRDVAAVAAILASSGGRRNERASEGPTRALATLMPLLQALRLVGEDGRPRIEAWRRVARRPRWERTVGLLAPLLGAAVPRDLAAHVTAGLLSALAAPAGVSARAFAPAAVTALSALLALKSALVTSGAGALASGLKDLNVLVEADEGLVLNPRLVSHEVASSAIVQPNFEVTFTGGLLMGDSLEVALAAEARRVDAVATFEITRGSFQRYLDLGGTADRLLEVLDGLAGGQPGRATAALPQNLVFSLRTWEREYRRLALYEGVVLVADDEHQYLFDNSPLLRPHVRKKIAPGVYLLSPADRDSWIAAIRRAGVDHVPEVVAVSPLPERGDTEAELPFEETLLGADLSVDIRPPRPARAGDGGGGSDLLAELARMELPEEEAAEIRDRIRRGLVLVPAQLRTLATEKGEARGLDYLGKVRLIERAIERGALVEMLGRAPSGAPKRILARPRKLEKTAGGLILAAESVPEGQPLKIPVSRLSRVRLVSRSLLD